MRYFLAILAIAALPALAFAHSAMDRFWGEVPVDMLISGDVLVTKTLTVPRDVTLTIEPGTTVRFDASKDGGNRILIKGKLVAAGTKDRPIRFVPRDDKSGRWYGLEFAPGAGGRLENCVIEGSSHGVRGAGPGVTTRYVEIH